MQRVLVVDDDRLVADTLALIFQKDGFEAKAVYTADDGLKYAHQFSPNLLLCDVTMPDRDGLSLLRDVAQDLPSCRIIVLTGHYSKLNPLRDQSKKLPRPVGILTKPCQPAELLRQAKDMLATA
jgi:CheY-like chemotaxis protein